MISHQIKVTVFVKGEEDFDKIKNGLLELFPFNLEEEKLAINENIVEGFDEKKIKILEVVIDKERHTKGFIENLLKNLSNETKEVILRQAESRLDNEMMFYMRFSKEKWLNEKTLWLTDQGNCFHIKMSLAAFPKKREKALELIQKVFKV
jgi:RNA-binding protein